MMPGLNFLLWGRMQFLRWTHWRPLVKAAKDPSGLQGRWLLRHLARNAGTRFGREHGFGDIRSPEEFSTRVPVQTYESLRPYIEEQADTGRTALTTDHPIMYTQTSGTTDKPKLIPLLESTLDNHRRSQATQAFIQYSTVPGAYSGRILPIVSPAVEGTLPSGTPFGSASGHLYRNMPRLARSKYVLPHEVFEIDDYDLKYLTILRLALPHPDVTLMGSANPSTFVRLLDLMGRNREELLSDISEQDFRHLDKLPTPIADAVRPRLRTSAARITELKRALSRPAPSFEDVWPELRMVNTWTCGSCRIALEGIRGMVPASTWISELGYISSEFRGTITVDPERGLGMPTVTENFFEFAERDAWDAGDPHTLRLEQLQTGHEYYVIVTTEAGLYRYFMNDLVEVTGRFHATPTIQFVQKGKGVTNITGEKLCESQVIRAVHETGRKLGKSVKFLLMLALPEESRYRLVIELDLSVTEIVQWTEAIEGSLAGQNVEYNSKRESGRLEALEVVPVLPGTGEEYKRHLIAQGQREGQFKLLALRYADECAFDFLSRAQSASA